MKINNLYSNTKKIYFINVLPIQTFDGNQKQTIKNSTKYEDAK